MGDSGSSKREWFEQKRFEQMRFEQKRAATKQATVAAVGHVVAQFTAADCIFLNKQRQQRRQHAPGIQGLHGGWH